MDELLNFAKSFASTEVAKGFGTALAAMVFAYLTKDFWFRVICYIVRDNKRKITNEEWHTVFVQRGGANVEKVTLRAVPFTPRYVGIVEYKRPHQPKPSHYVFDGRFTNGLLTGIYKDEDDSVVDCGAWTLRLHDDGKALVGGYVWLVDSGEIGYDVYQWTECSFNELLNSSESKIDGSGVFAKIPLPKGALVGEFRGVPVDIPTRRSIRVHGENIEPLEECKLRFLNHSCTPTAYFEGQLIFLLKGISEQDEITIDYRKTEQVFSSTFECLCPTCKIAKRPISFRSNLQ